MRGGRGEKNGLSGGESAGAREAAVLEVAVDRHLRAILPPLAYGPRRRPPRKEMYAEGGIEPRLEELLNDPLTETLMRRDGVSAASLRELISSTRKCLRERVVEP
jgi:hypothetical protein